MKIFNVGLMIDSGEPNGFQAAMCKKAIGGTYRELNCGRPDFNQQLLNIAEGMRPDIIFIQVQTPNIIDHNVARRISEISYVIQWNGDIRAQTPDWGIELGKIIQLTTYSNMRDVLNTRSLGIKSEFLQVGIDPKRYNRHQGKVPSNEIVFMGNNYHDMFPLSRERESLVGFLKSRYGNRFGVYGNGWNKPDGNLMSDQRLESMTYNNAKIAINQNHFNEKRFTSDRLFRALASGVLVISHEFQMMDLDFEVGRHLVTYKNFDDLAEKIDYYLKNDLEREKIAQCGYEYCHNNFTFDKMCENIIKLYENRNTVST